MLMNLREKVSGWMGWVVIALIIAAFSLFGISYYIEDSTRAYAAKVNDVEIPVAQAQRVYQQTREQIRQSMGKDFNPDTFDEAGARKRAINSLVNNEVLFQTVNDSGFAVSDVLLAAQIQATPLFQVDEKFSAEQYRTLLKRQGIRPGQYERQVSRDLIVKQLQNGIAGTRAVPVSVVNRLLQIQGQQREVRYFVVPTAAFESEVDVSDDDIRDYYEANRDQFVEPEKVMLEYIELGAPADSSGFAVDEAEVDRLYQERVDALKAQEERRARHILVAVSGDASEAEVKAAKEKAEKALKRIEAGEDFGAVASEMSDDTVSAKEGGDLGFFERGAMVPAFDEAVFSMKQGEVSGPIRSGFGFHVIRLEAIKSKDIPAKADIREELAEQIRTAEAEDEYLDKIEALSNLSFENPDSLEPAADALGLEIRKTEWVSRSGGQGDVTANRKVMAAAFADDVLLRGNNSEVVELPDNRAVVVRVEGHREPTPRALDEVRDSIRVRLVSERAATRARLTAEAYVAELDAGAEISEVADKANAKLVTPETLTRSDRNVDPGILREAFQLPRPQPGKPVNSITSTIGGGFAVVQLLEVTETDPSAIPEGTREAVRQNLERILGQVDRAALLDALKAKAEIDISENVEDL